MHNEVHSNVVHHGVELLLLVSGAFSIQYKVFRDIQCLPW